MSGLEIPFRARGPWTDVRIEPDVAAMFKDPENITKSVQKITETIKKLNKGGNIGQLIEGFFGGTGGRKRGSEGRSKDSGGGFPGFAR